MVKKLKMPKKCEDCNTELVCCEGDSPYTKDSRIIEARKCPECERVYFMGHTSFDTWLAR